MSVVSRKPMVVHFKLFDSLAGRPIGEGGIYLMSQVMGLI